MSATAPARMVNHLIGGLPRNARNRFLDRCESVDLVFGTILCEPDQPFRHVHLPLTGFISLVTTVGGHPPLEMGLIGNEGMLGVSDAGAGDQCRPPARSRARHRHRIADDRPAVPA